MAHYYVVLVVDPLALFPIMVSSTFLFPIVCSLPVQCVDWISPAATRTWNAPTPSHRIGVSSEEVFFLIRKFVPICRKDAECTYVMLIDYPSESSVCGTVSDCPDISVVKAGRPKFLECVDLRMLPCLSL